ncbi:hypothetical protein, partial [Haloferula sp. A504]|uniref:hypothetical protein n=1 Tax=Haloferula sp. A504 TaxID=3373601 RepID=UPI0031C668D8|nr:hypothetical protein [Verrucomicrobiaceae bacterium E54]
LEPDTAPPFQPSNHPEGAWLAPVAAIGSRQKIHMAKPKIRGRYVFIGAGILALSFAAWFWLTTFVSEGYWNFPDTCPVHQVETTSEFVENRGVVTISHGFDWITEKREFYPLDTFNDGYGHPNKRYRRILQKYCPECRRARHNR